MCPSSPKRAVLPTSTGFWAKRTEADNENTREPPHLQFSHTHSHAKMLVNAVDDSLFGNWMASVGCKLNENAQITLSTRPTLKLTLKSSGASHFSQGLD
jgi:hypothetical protein